MSTPLLRDLVERGHHLVDGLLPCGIGALVMPWSKQGEEPDRKHRRQASPEWSAKDGKKRPKRPENRNGDQAAEDRGEDQRNDHRTKSSSEGVGRMRNVARNEA